MRGKRPARHLHPSTVKQERLWEDFCSTGAPQPPLSVTVDRKKRVKPKRVKPLEEAIILVLREAGPEGLTVKELVQRMNKKELYECEDEESLLFDIEEKFSAYADIFVARASSTGKTFALQSLQEDERSFNSYSQETDSGRSSVRSGTRSFDERESDIDYLPEEASSPLTGGLSKSQSEDNPRKARKMRRVEECIQRPSQSVQVEVSTSANPMLLKEAIILVLEEAGPEGLKVKELVQRLKEKELWDWENEKQGPQSVYGTCHTHSDVFVRVTPGTYALLELQNDDSTPHAKPKSLKEAIIRVLQEAGPGGLHIKEIVQRMKEKFSWDWEDDEKAYNSVASACRETRNRDVFVRVAPGTYALVQLQGDNSTPHEKPKITLKEAIILVLEEAGPGGLKVKELVQRLKKEELWVWENDKTAYHSVSRTCQVPRNHDIFIEHSPCLYALRCLQGEEGEEEGSAKVLAKEKADDDAERITSGSTKRTREAASGSGGESNQITVNKKKKKKQVLQEPQSDVVPVEDRRLLLYSNEQEVDRGDAWLERALEQETQACAERSADRQKVAKGTFEKPKTLKEAIILVLEEAGPEGLKVKELVQRLKEKELWDWENEKQGPQSVSGICSTHSDVFVRVTPGTYALLELQNDDSTPHAKPKSLKEAIIRVLQEAGPGGLHIKEIVQRMKEKFSWDWEDDEKAYNSVASACRETRNRDVFVRVAPGTYALLELQGDDFTPHEKPKITLKEAIILVLQEAGPGGLKVKELVQRLKEEELWDWENESSGPSSVKYICRNHPDVFMKHSLGVYALRSLQEGEEEGEEGSAKALAKEKADDDAERIPSGSTKRARGAADGSADELDQITVNKKKKKKQVLEEPQSDVVPVEDRRLLLYSNEQEVDRGDAWLERALENKTISELETIKDGVNKRIELLSGGEGKKKKRGLQDGASILKEINEKVGALAQRFGIAH